MKIIFQPFMVAFSLLLMIQAHTVFAADPTKHKAYFHKKRALLKIEIVYTDKTGKRITSRNRELGQGVFITPKGVILTAAHVIFPNKKTFEKLNASGYYIKVYEYYPGTDTEVSRYGPESKKLNGDFVAGNSLFNLENRFLTNCSNQSSSLCLDSDPPSKLDFVLLNTYWAATPFIGLAGHKEKLSELNGSPSSSGYLAVLSDFNNDGHVTFQPVEMTVVGQYRGLGNQQFIEGVSGSPVIVVNKFMPGIFVLGVVNRSEPISNGDVSSYKFKSAPIKPIESALLKKNSAIILESFGVLPNESYKYWNCFGSRAFPSPNSMFGDYIASKLNANNKIYEGILSEDSIRIIRDCGHTLGWAQTITELEYLYDFFN